MGNLFNSIKIKTPGRNVFDLSHDVKLSTRMGRLTPTMALEVVPGDSFNIGCESLLRFAPMLAPVMHRVNVYMHYWYVPNRILWPNWEDFITGISPAPAHPYLPIGAVPGSNWGPLADYLGIKQPIGVNIENVNAFPFAAYQMIYNEFYRDQNFITEVDSELVNGDNNANTGLYSIRLRAWEHDYFTSALPTAQAGAAVELPLGEVVLKDDWATTSGGDFAPSWVDETGVREVGDIQQELLTGGAFNADIGVTLGGDTTEAFAYDPQGSLEVQATTINDLRAAFRLQEWLEKSLRAGRRYSESILSHFGVRPLDMRLQRPEYITGTASPVIISEVLNTTGDTGAAEPLPQGNMSGHGVSVTSGKYGRYNVKEHGWIIGIMSVMPKTAYEDGIERKFFKTTFLDYYWPEFAHLGEQAVLNKEVYAFQGATGLNTFGYNPRYSEYKFCNNRVAGDFRDTLNFWHLGRKFAAAPSLNQDFIEMDPEDVERIFAVQDGTDELWCQVLHKIRAIRPMPKFGTPTF